MLGWDRRRVSTYYHRGRLPPPLAVLASGPVWSRRSIAALKRELSGETLGPRFVEVRLWVQVHNAHRYVRGKSKSLKDIERLLRPYYPQKEGRAADQGTYTLTIIDEGDQNLLLLVDEMLWQMRYIAESRNGYIEFTVTGPDGEPLW